MAMSKLEPRLAAVESKMSEKEDLESTEAKSRSDVGSEAGSWRI